MNCSENFMQQRNAFYWGQAIILHGVDALKLLEGLHA
jgi:hypothetical protein